MKTMPRELQISAFVSPETRDLLERRVRATGIKKGRLVEQALRHHLMALDELPEEAMINPRIVVSRATGAAMLKSIRNARPTSAMRTLMRDGV